MELLFTAVTLFAIFIAGLGVYGLVSPRRLLSFVALWRSRAGLWTAAGVRVAFGLALWLVAPYGHVPLALKILGSLMIAAGVALPLMGLVRFEAILDWWCALPAKFQRVWMTAAAMFGLFLLWAVAG